MNEIIDELDEAPLPDSAWGEIAFELISLAGLNDPDALQMVQDYSKGRLTAGQSTPTADAIWAKAGDPDLTKYEEAKYRLLGCLNSQGWTPLDGYGAEYLFAWADDLGLEQATVVESFRRRMP